MIINWGGKRRTAGKSIILEGAEESKQMDGFKSCPIPGVFYNDLLFKGLRGKY